MASLHDVELTALESPAAQALMLLLAKYPDMLNAAAKISRRTTSRSTCASWPLATTATTTPSEFWSTTRVSRKHVWHS